MFCFFQARTRQNYILNVRTVLKWLQKQYWNASTTLLCWQLPNSTEFKRLDYERNRKRQNKKKTNYFTLGCKRPVNLIRICTKDRESKLHPFLKKTSEKKRQKTKTHCSDRNLANKIRHRTKITVENGKNYFGRKLWLCYV